ncbi:MAG TPA: hypothetical protein VFV95_09220 [Vicinamibacterales bacterium]|nr:hypothetical protein [Vicinamibacterales bacterium]
MKRAVLIVCALAVTVPALRAQQPLAITRVLLYKNGMAYIVRSGQLTAPLSLTFHPEDMNDVLKSFMAWNPDTGALYSVGYTAGIPSSHMLSRFPFDITPSDTGLGGFLMQVKGADVRLEHNGKTLEGKLMAAQQTERVTAPQTVSPDYRMTVLLRDGSLQTIWLGDVRSVEFSDRQMRDQLRSYLEVLAAGRQDVTREVSVYPVPAAGPIQVAYLQQFPLWKTSYRVDLGANESRIQGWAQIDNPTGEAWENVTVSLLSGAPVSFLMNLYDPLYTNRATVPVPGGQVAAPRRYESAVIAPAGPAALAETPRATDVQNARVAQGQAGAGGRGGGRGTAGGVAGGVPGGVVGGVTNANQGRLTTAAAPPPPPVFDQAEAARVEDFYEYKFPFPVRIASRQSALLPFLQRTIQVEKLSIFNARTDRGNPRLGARLENTTDIPFESGPVTFFQDTRYAGEAIVDYLPRGEKALISYGVDYDVQIAGKRQARPETTARMTVSQGVAVLFMESVQTTTYEIRNKGMDRKTLILEHPRQSDRRLEGAEPFETTENFYRFRLTLGASEATTLAVPEIVARQTSVSLQEMTRPQLALFAGSATPQAVRERLGAIVDLQEQIAAQKLDAQAAQTLIDVLFRDQERLRENLKALRTGARDLELRARYLDQLKKQEDQMEAAQAQLASVNRDIVASQAKLSDLISTFVFGV